MSHAPASALERRHAELRRVLADGALDALVVTSLPNVTYLTNFVGSAAIAVVTPDALHFLTDSRYVAALERLAQSECRCPGLALTAVDGSYDGALARLIGESGRSTIGFEAAHLSVSRHQWLTARTAAVAPAMEWIATEGLIESLRVVKDHYEQQVLREAGRRLSAVAAAVIGEVKAGMSERDLGFAIDARIRAAGFSKPAFETIVASGPNGGLPHARPSERKLTEGDLVVLDFGGVYDSYCVDLTRTVCIGQPSPRVREVYDAVRAAHDDAVAAVGPGQSRFAIDGAARDRLAAAGMGEAFGHGTGHGL